MCPTSPATVRATSPRPTRERARPCDATTSLAEHTAHAPGRSESQEIERRNRFDSLGRRSSGTALRVTSIVGESRLLYRCPLTFFA